jgi:hypothetical protein
MSTDLQTQKERMDVLATADSEMNSIIAERRIQTALKKAIPAANLNTLDIGDKAPVYREKADLWEGPYKISALEDKIVTVSIKDTAKRFSIHQVNVECGSVTLLSLVFSIRVLFEILRETTALY